ncbi:chondroitin sulfate synthase 2-like [Ornithodoros turicata]|uniref:chondroitin sulfate synthase 2-like n=1 Tax=Ornithodoros turicata TaxID=34597 RepID=UPI0031399901
MLHCVRLPRKVLNQKLVPLGICVGVIISLVIVPFIGCQNRRLPERQLRRRFAASPAEGDFEPVLNLQGKPKTSSGSSPEKLILVRPRFYTTELEIREKLLVAVFTTPETISTFGVALNRTLSKYPSKVVYFSCTSRGGKGVRTPSVILLTETNCDGIAFQAIKHMFVKNMVKDYDFVFLVRDSTYVNGEKLFSLSSHLSVSSDAFVGRVVYGADHCDLDAGILLSNGVFHQMAAKMDNLCETSDTKDESFGTCIVKATGLRCTSSMQGQTYHALNLEKDLGYAPDPSALATRKDFSKTITVFPVLSAKYHYRLHHYFGYYNLNKAYQHVERTESSITGLSSYVGGNNGRLNWPVGVDSPVKPSGRFDVLRCINFNSTHMFWWNDHTAIVPISGAEKLSLNDITRSAEDYLRRSSPGRNTSIARVEDGYRTFDPMRGLSYVIDVVTRDRDAEALRRLQFLRPLSKSEILQMPYVTEHTRVVMVLFVKQNELDHVTLFIEEYAKTCLEKNDNTMLLLAFLQTAGSDESFDNVRNFALGYADRFQRSNAKLATLVIRIPNPGRMPSDFALVDLVARKLPAESLVLLCQTGMEIRTDYLNRVRMNTIAGIQVFLPIPFTQFHPVISEQSQPTRETVELRKENGFFDSNGYSHMSFYVSDYWRLRVLISKEVPIAHASTDLSASHYHRLPFGIVELFLVSRQVHLLRATEPSLRVHYVWRECESEPNLRAIENCKLSSLSAVGSKAQQAKYLLAGTELPKTTSPAAS